MDETGAMRLRMCISSGLLVEMISTSPDTQKQRAAAPDAAGVIEPTEMQSDRSFGRLASV